MQTNALTSNPIHFNFRKIYSAQTYKNIFAAIDKHELFILSGSIAYTTALALAPFLIIMLSILTLLSDASQGAVVRELSALLGPQAGEAMNSIINNAERQTTFRGISGIISFLILAVSASAIFTYLKNALNKIDEYKEPPGRGSEIWQFVRQRIFSIGLVFGFIFLLIISLIVTTGIAAVFNGREGFLWEALAMVGNLAVFTVLFAALFHYVPSRQRRWSACFQSALVATVFFLIGKTLISLYLGKSAVGSAYGAAGSLVVLLVWLYYTAFTLLLSFEYSNTILSASRYKVPPSRSP